MATGEITTTSIPTKADISAKIEDVTIMVRAYFSQFTKTTSGQQLMGESSLKFAEDCDRKAAIFPEVLSGNFDKADAKLKLGGAQDFFAFKKKVMEALNEWEIAAKICKSDAMFYANKLYNAIQSEAKDNVKYQPTLDELKAFYKKTIDEKKAAEKINSVSTAASN